MEGVVEVIGTLMRRKKQLFPDDDRTIVSWEVSESGGQCRVTVASWIGGSTDTELNTIDVTFFDGLPGRPS